MRAVVDRAKAGMAVLGICNGFQILVETELLPGALMRNAGLKFVCRDVHLRVENSESPFTRGYNAGAVVRMPVAHGEGNYFADQATLDRLEGEGLVAFRYVTAEGETKDDANPNGSARHIAGVFGKDRRVLGLMPHPERLADMVLGGLDGRAMFDGLVEALA
jgi:phosphoribosylformylglycinamidine synthase